MARMPMNAPTHPGRACSGRLPGCRLGWSPLCAFPPVILSGARNAESKDPVRCQPEAFLLMPRRILRLRRGALSLRMAEVGVSRCARDDGERQRRLTAECEAPGKNFRDCEELHAVYFWRPGIMLSTFRQGLKMNPKNRFRHRNSGKSCHLSARGLREGKGKGKGKGLALTFEGPEAAGRGLPVGGYPVGSCPVGGCPVGASLVGAIAFGNGTRRPTAIATARTGMLVGGNTSRLMMTAAPAGGRTRP